MSVLENIVDNFFKWLLPRSREGNKINQIYDDQTAIDQYSKVFHKIANINDSKKIAALINFLKTTTTRALSIRSYV